MSGGEAGGTDSRLTVEGQRFAVVPEWIIDSDIGDAAFRLYAVLLRYGHSSGKRMPSRATLARRLRKRSVDTVDRAMRELVSIGAVVVERRTDGRRHLTNLYHVRTTAPGRTPAATQTSGRGAAAPVGRTDAAPPASAAAASPAAEPRLNPDVLTESSPPPIRGDGLAAVRRVRDPLGLSMARWTDTSIAAAVDRALGRGWPAELMLPALLRVAADPATLSPMRLAEAGPWWDRPPGVDIAEDLRDVEAELDALDGRRVVVQRLARQQLVAEGAPLTKSLVLRRAAELARAGS